MPATNHPNLRLGRAHPEQVTPPRRSVTVLAWVMALWCTGFALVNVVYELTDHFAGPRLEAYGTGLHVVNLLVVGPKLLGAAVALLTVSTRRSVVPVPLLTVLVWAAFSLLGVYALGNVVETAGMVSGVAGSIDEITVRNIGYVLFFLFAAVGYGVLAISYSRRVGWRKRAVVLGVLGGPAGMALLFGVAALLLGLMPA